MTSLPPNRYAPGFWHEAYDICLRFESDCQNLPLVRASASPLICARFLGYMILEAPTDRGRDNCANEIKDCADEETLMKLANLYINDHVRCSSETAVKSAKGRTPTPSEHPSRPSFDDTQEALKYLLQQAPQNHTTAKSKALIRDSYRCTLTGHYDKACYLSMNTIRRKVDSCGLRVAVTEAAHIFPESMNARVSGENEGGVKREYAASVWAVMERFGQAFVTEELNSPDIHRLQNILTMEASKHEMFDSLQLWLESTGSPNCYKVNSVAPALQSDIPDIVTFTTSDPLNLPLPSPDYLHLHAACARVAHLSGAGEHIDRVFRDMEEMQVLAVDGSSTDILSYALSSSVKFADLENESQ
ncbi:hypothetical protein EW146_g1228 [Bondarzewia mesenterica]|uniref:HNH nuclease domain-containing protein n=1 Tax=Bondarzewia mesenterica TaxID=1095465 RepID=A0A4S4M4C6_9AGAM|nr:hypothetical protein EW146_g1228 [Bondarzewia mesenterica]